MYEEKTYENIKQEILSNINKIDKREGSFVDDMVSPVSLEFEKAYTQFAKMLGIMFLEDSTGKYLEKRANEFGLKRKKGICAVSTIKFKGQDGTIISAKSLVSTSTGLLYLTNNDLIINDGQVTGEITAMEVGSKYNVPENTITSIPITINGVTSVTNPYEIISGADKETDEELLKRLLLFIRNPATSGNCTHYKLWAMQVEGIYDAKIFPCFFGNGTVLVMPISKDKRSPGDNMIKLVKQNIENNRPIGSTVTVQGPKEIIINVNASIVLDNTVSLSKVKSVYIDKLKKYIKDGVFNISVIDYYKCLSLAYEVKGIKQVIDFKLNNRNDNIIIGQTEIQVVGMINIEEQEE